MSTGGAIVSGFSQTVLGSQRRLKPVKHILAASRGQWGVVWQQNKPSVETDVDMNGLCRLISRSGCQTDAEKKLQWTGSSGGSSWSWASVVVPGGLGSVSQ